MLSLILPLIGFLFSFFGRYLGKQIISTFIISTVGMAFITACINAYTILGNKITIKYSFKWITLNEIDLQFTFLLDSLSIILILLITFITFLVMIYSSSYLEQDPSLIRFLSYLALFCFCMLTLVISGNYVQLFIGWEGVGLSSYLLISFWHTRTEANRGALKAVLLNRIGDVFFMLALGICWILFKSFDFNTIFQLYPELLEIEYTILFLNTEINFKTLLTLFLLLAACAKSAQFLLHTWLPDAMEGPTPVSSLLHSATMVTAGVFLIIRSSTIFSFTPNLSYIMALLGVLTALISGLIGMNQYDLKRIIAYSTCSQLGFMILACGLGYYTYALFHLITHAFFKCLLFLCSGAILHALGDEQDIRRMGNLFYFMPITFIIMLIGTIALVGFPMLSGYYSKDLILETAYSSSSFGIFIFILASLAAFLTSFYSIRSLYFVFFGKTFPANKHVVPFIEDAPLPMHIPMSILAICSIFSGYILTDIFTGSIGLFFQKISILIPILSSLIEHEFELLFIKLFPTFAGFCGLLLGYTFFASSYFYYIYLTQYSFFNLTNQQFFFTSLYNLLAKLALNFGYFQYKILDRGLLELFSGTGFYIIILKIKQKIQYFFISGYLLHYLILSIGAILILNIYINIFSCDEGQIFHKVIVIPINSTNCDIIDSTFMEIGSKEYLDFLKKLDPRLQKVFRYCYETYNRSDLIYVFNNTTQELGFALKVDPKILHSSIISLKQLYPSYFVDENFGIKFPVNGMVKDEVYLNFSKLLTENFIDVFRLTAKSKIKQFIDYNIMHGNCFTLQYFSNENEAVIVIEHNNYIDFPSLETIENLIKLSKKSKI